MHHGAIDGLLPPIFKTFELSPAYKFSLLFFIRHLMVAYYHMVIMEPLGVFRQLLLTGFGYLGQKAYNIWRWLAC
jgi:hypothetical protein